MPNPNRPIVRLFFAEVMPGDRAKLIAQSNQTQSGGGARDLRFPDTPFRDFLEHLFPEAAPKTTALGNRPVRKGTLWTHNRGTEVDQEYWPPTNRRPSEGRLARIHEIPSLRENVPPEDPVAGRVFLLLLQDGEGTIYPQYINEQQLRTTASRRIAGPILDCIHRATERTTDTWTPRVIGYVDYESGKRYCHE